MSVKATCTFFVYQLTYLVEEVDNLGENVEASPWVDGCLVKDSCL